MIIFRPISYFRTKLSVPRSTDFETRPNQIKKLIFLFENNKIQIESILAIKRIFHEKAARRHLDSSGLSSILSSERDNILLHKDSLTELKFL